MLNRLIVLSLVLTALAWAATLPPQVAWIAQTPGLKSVDLKAGNNVSFAVTGDGNAAYNAVRDRLKKEGWAVTEKPGHDMVRDGRVWASIHKELRAVKDGHCVEVFLSTVKGRPDWPAPLLQVGLTDWNMP